MLGGASVPQFWALAADGSVVSTDSTRGKVVVLTWWAHWCLPCREELRDFDRFYRSHRAQGLELVALDADMNDENYRFRPPTPQAAFRFATVFKGASFPLEGVPTTYVVDRRGRIAATFHGSLSPAKMRSTILPLLREARSGT